MNAMPARNLYRAVPRQGMPTGLTSQKRRYAAAKSNDIEGLLEQKSYWDTFPRDIQKLAVFADHARSLNYQIPQLSKAQQGVFDQDRAYKVAAAIRQLRTMNGDVVKGRKLGFTNKQLWAEYGINESCWSYMYANSIVDVPRKQDLGEGKVVLANISHLSALEPKIEPEIVFGLRSPVRPGMSDLEILQCVDWVAHGLEVVASIFPHWKFTLPDATAGFALHALLLIGQRVPISDPGVHGEGLLDKLRDFRVELYQNGQKVEEGRGSNVLGSPINALRSLAELLAKDQHNQPLEADEIVTTGTLTRALSINNGDLWSTKIKGLSLPGLEVTFKLK